MATNLKREDKKADPRSSRPNEPQPSRFSWDLKWFVAALGLAAIVFSSVVIGVKVSIDHFTNQSKTVTQFVKEMPAKPGPIFPVVNDQVVNLNGGRYLRFTAAIQFAQDDLAFPPMTGENKHMDPLANYEALIKDAIVSVTSHHTSVQLLDPTGKDKLKDELRAVINQQLKASDEARDDVDRKAHPVPVVYKIYFTSFVIS